MRIFLTICALLMLMLSLNACPKPEVEDAGGSISGGGGAAPPPPPPSYKDSKLASLGHGKVGMSFDDIKAAFPEDSGYKLDEPVPDSENPVMVSATPADETAKLNEAYGLLGGEVVYIIQSGNLTEEEYNAKIAELTANLGEPVKEIPEILKKTKFFSGEQDEAAGADDAEDADAAAGEGAEKETPEDAQEGIDADLPENAVFWVDEAANLVILAGLDEGEAGFMLLRTDKIDEHFDEFNKIMEEMYTKMFEEMQKGMGGAAPPAEGDAPPAETETPPAEGGN